MNGCRLQGPQGFRVLGFRVLRVQGFGVKVSQSFRWGFGGFSGLALRAWCM